MSKVPAGMVKTKNQKSVIRTGMLRALEQTTEKGKTMTYKERLIELLQHSPTDAMGNHGVGAMADHLMDNGLVFKEMYDDIEERLAQQRVRAQTAEFFICKLCENCDYEDNDGITAMTMKCCSMFPECGKFKLRSGWIPVSERLPGVFKAVIVCTKFQEIGEAQHNGKHFVWIDDEGAYDYAHVTHWTPLPEPPTRENT